jgi:guanine nucleotide-binding protein subunit alpha
MADSQPDEKHVGALIGSVGANMRRLRQAIDGLRQIHDRWKDDSGTSINLIAQLTALKSNMGNMQDWLTYAIDGMHPQLLSDLQILMSSCALLVRHLDVLVNRLRQPDHDAVDCAIKLKYAVGSRSMERLRKVAKTQNEAVTLLLAACKWYVWISKAWRFKPRWI